MAQLTGAQIDMVGGTRKEWFYDPLLTIAVACAMFVYGIYALNEETRLVNTRRIRITCLPLFPTHFPQIYEMMHCETQST